MIYEYTTNYQDFLAAQKLARRKNLRTLIFFYACNWLLPALGLIACALVVLDMLENNFSFPSWGVSFLVIFGLWSIVLPLQQYRRMKRGYKNMKNGRSDDEPVILELDGNQMISRIPGKSEGRFFPNAVQNFIEDEKIALIYLAKSRFLIIPKRAIPENDWVDIRAWIARRDDTRGVSS